MSGLAAKGKIRRTTRVPKYISIAEAVKADIAKGALLPHDRLPSFSSMTQQFNVAIHTIDKAHAVLEQEGLIRREPGRGVFVEPTRNRSTGNLGLLLRKMDSNWYSRALLKGIQKQALELGLNLMLIDENDPAIAQKTDGALLCCRSCDVAPLNLPESLPKVLTLEHATNLDIANVVADDFNGARLATEHLIALGHRRISYILAAPSDPYARHRLAGYRAALSAAGIEFDADLVRYIAGEIDHYYPDTDILLTTWLAEGWRELNSTAIMAPNDDCMFGILRALKRAGLDIPGDVSLVGFDGQQVLQPPPPGTQSWTTVLVPLEEIGAASVSLLWDQILHGGHTKEVVVPVQLKTGETTAPLI